MAVYEVPGHRGGAANRPSIEIEADSIKTRRQSSKVDQVHTNTAATLDSKYLFA
jgi:hypothetical protein